MRGIRIIRCPGYSVTSCSLFIVHVCRLVYRWRGSFRGIDEWVVVDGACTSWYIIHTSTNMVRPVIPPSCDVPVVVSPIIICIPIIVICNYIEIYAI